MATLAEFRAQYPQYDSVPDLTLADSLHEKFYSKIPKIEFYKTIGLGTATAIPGAESGRYLFFSKACGDSQSHCRGLGLLWLCFCLD